SISLEPSFDRSYKAGLRPFRYFRWERQARTIPKHALRNQFFSLRKQRRQAPNQSRVDQRNSHFERMRHTRPIGIAQQLVAHIERGFEYSNFAKRGRGFRV